MSGEYDLAKNTCKLIHDLRTEVARLNAELAARTEEKDALAAALEIADECIDTIRLNPDDAFSYADQYVNGGELDKPTAILASRDAKVRAKGMRKAAERAQSTFDDNPQPKHIWAWLNCLADAEEAGEVEGIG
jgi:hypothetical protein